MDLAEMSLDAVPVAAARAGDRSAFDVVVQRYQARIARYLLSLVHDPELALDLTQDTFVEAFRGIHALRSDLALGAWLYRIATHQAFRAHRRSRRIAWQPLANVEDSMHATVEAPDDAVMARELVQHALAQLPRDRLAALLLHAKEGFSYNEVAAIVGTTPEAARKRIARAKEQFRALYDDALTRSEVTHAVR
jgi:RNA polymerase sigma-70 factor (ECF subfamily)